MCELRSRHRGHNYIGQNYAWTAKKKKVETQKLITALARLSSLTAFVEDDCTVRTCVCIAMCIDVCTDTCIDMCMDVSIEPRMCVCISMCTGMCVDGCVDNAHRHVYRNV